MNRRRITAALAAAFLPAVFPAAPAFADSYDIVADPGSTETVTGFYGLVAPSPAVPGSIQGYQLFDVNDTTTGTTVGTFEADESSGQELLVTQVINGTPGTAPGDVPPVGSVLETFTVGGFSNVYSDLASTTPGADLVSDILVTPFGSFTVPVPFDAAERLATDSVDTTPVYLADGYAIAADPNSAETLTAINGHPPLDVVVQGFQQFDVVNPTGATVGTFDADVANTSDIVGNTTEAVLVDQDLTGTVGTAAGDVPPDGSVFNVFYLFGNSNIYNISADLPSPSGNVISDTVVTPFGDLAIPITFDAAAGLPATGSVGLPDGYEFVPASTEQLAGINGIPPLDVAVQGYQVFDVDSPATGNTIGTFDADVTTQAVLFGESGEAVLVTSDMSGTTGTAAGNVPPVGSVFDFVYLGGLENIYSDLASPSGDVISDTLVTPFGDFAIPIPVDLAAGLAADMFLTLP